MSDPTSTLTSAFAVDRKDTGLDLRALEAGAAREAKWDGRTFDTLGRADKQRYLDRFADGVAAYLATLPQEPAPEPAWLVTNGPDGQRAKVVTGFENLKREVVTTVFGSADDDSDEAQDMRDRLDTPSDWEGDRWSMSWSFEDGYLTVQRITDMPLYAAPVASPLVGEDAVERIAVLLLGSVNAPEGEIYKVAREIAALSAKETGRG